MSDFPRLFPVVGAEECNCYDVDCADCPACAVLARDEPCWAEPVDDEDEPSG